MTDGTHDDIGVLVAGIGGASLGMEMYKSLVHADRYRIVGADASPLAYGHGEPGFVATHVIDATSDDGYVTALLERCAEHGIEAVAPGAGATHDLLHRHRERFAEARVLAMINGYDVVERCTDKVATMAFLADRGVPVPATVDRSGVAGFDAFPCVVKPARDSGASNLVFLAEDRAELEFFVSYLEHRNVVPVVQQYVPSDFEVTAGVASTPDGSVLSCTILRRSLSQKLSVAARYGDRVISSGWSQGDVVVDPDLAEQVLRIAAVLGSTWALNVQGRVDADGTLLPFEVNPRHSGTTHLRTLAGCNEPDLLLQRVLRGATCSVPAAEPGAYARAFTEKQVGTGVAR